MWQPLWPDFLSSLVDTVTFKPQISKLCYASHKLCWHTIMLKTHLELLQQHIFQQFPQAVFM